MFNNIKTINFLIFFTICLSVSVSQAYRISGIVLDLETKEPINNVIIYIENSDVGTETNQDGYFKLYLNNYSPNSIRLKIKMIGYEEKSLPIDLSSSEIYLGKLFLIVESLELETIHIHSNKNTSIQISDITLGGQKLNDHLTGNLATTLSNQPNIGVNSFGTVTSKPVLRGYSGSRFILIKDGSNTGDLSQSSIDHVITLDMTEVSEIEIVRGPKSLIYGSNTIGGVINTIIIGNPKVRVENLFKKFIFGGESFNKGIYGNLILYIPIKNNQINLVFNKRDTGNQTSPIGELDNTYSQTYNYKIGFTTYNKTNYINLKIENFNMDYGIPPSSEGHINGVDIDLIKNTFQLNYHQDISSYGINQFDIKYNFIDYKHKEFENNLDYYSVGLSNRTHNFKIEFQSFNMIFGSELNYKQFLPSGFYWTPKTNEINISLYSFYEKDFNSFDFLSSFRMSHLSIQPDQSNLSFSNIDNEKVKKRNFQYVSSSIGIRKIINSLEINTWMMNTMSAPRVEELYSDGPHLGSYSYEIGEPELELEKTYGIESSIAYSSNPLNVSLTTFYNYSPYYYQMNKMGECPEEFVVGESHPCSGADFIEWGSGSSGWLYKYQIKGIESLIKGLEFNLDYRYQDFNIAYNFSLVKGDDLTNGISLPFMNPTKQIIIIGAEKDIINFQIRMSKTHAQDRLGEFETFTRPSLLVDFIVSYQNQNQNITIQLNNIFDQEYYNHLSKIKSIMPESGRNFVLNYKILF